MNILHLHLHLLALQLPFLSLWLYHFAISSKHACFLSLPLAMIFNSSKILFLTVSVSAAALILLLLVYLIYHFWNSLFHSSRTIPFDDITPLNLHKFSYKDLKSATNDFYPENAIGKGGTGSVFRGILKDGKSVAVKLLDPSQSFQVHKEFQNEINILGTIKSPHIVSLLGYCVHNTKRILVYEYMPNRSLQELLFSEENLGVVGWDRRFQIIQDVCLALEFLHNECDPPVIHGDVKPSNVLLDWDLRAKVSDFGLSRFKVEGGDQFGVDMFSQDLGKSQELSGNISETPAASNRGGQVDFAVALKASSCSKNGKVGSNSPKGKEALRIGVGDEDLSEKQWGKDWWWKQDGSGELSSKDYVKEWIGSQVCAKPSNGWDEEKATFSCEMNLDKGSTHSDTLRDSVECQSRRDRKKGSKSQEPKKMEDWWKEENLEEMNSKKGRKKTNRPLNFHLNRCFRMVRRRKCKETNGCIGRQEAEVGFKRGWRKKKRDPSVNTDDLFSRELSSTTSMRGTLCYVAPEYGGGGFLMEKTDIYSLGVLILVIVSGRRPLHVLNSPMKLEKANLVSWCRQLAQAGNVVELVDEKLKGVYHKEQAALCINLALGCLQRMPELRPEIGDIVRILRGELDLQPLAFEFSPSPPCRLRSKHQKSLCADVGKPGCTSEPF